MHKSGQWISAFTSQSGVVVDKDGIIYGAEVGPHKLQRYVKK